MHFLASQLYLISLPQIMQNCFSEVSGINPESRKDQMDAYVYNTLSRWRQMNLRRPRSGDARNVAVSPA